MTPKAKATIKLMQSMAFLKADFLKAVRQAASFTGDDIEDEKKIAAEIFNILVKEAK